MRKYIDLTGQKFGRLIVKEFVGINKWKKACWLCICDCGNILEVCSNALRMGKTKSCGCLIYENKTRLTHGFSSHPLYMVWRDMIQRCENPNHSAYKWYGDRDIKVCHRWHDPRNFFKDMGERPRGLTLERMNNNGNYEPGNCRWATPKEQRANSRPISCGPTKQRWFRAWHKDMMCQFMSNSQCAFARNKHLNHSTIAACLRGELRQHKGWTFMRI